MVHQNRFSHADELTCAGRYRHVMERPVSKALDFLNGKKSYIIAFLTALVGLLEAFGIVIPGWLWPILGSLGIVTIRHGITMEAAKAVAAAKQQ